MSPTNLPGGFSAWTWYEPSLGYATNGSTATLSNLTSFGSYYDLTNVAGTNSPFTQPAVAAINGLNAIGFNGVSSLHAATWTNFTPYEIFMLLAITNNVNGWMIGSELGQVRFSFQIGGATFVMEQNNSTDTHCRSVTNRYFVLDLVYSNSVPYFITNNVTSSTAGSFGTATNAFGLRMAGRPTDAAFKGQFSLASFFAFTNQVLTAAARSNAYYYLTNRFNLAVP